MVQHDLLNYNIYNTIVDTSIKHPRMVNPGQDYLFIRQNIEPGGIEIHTTEAKVDIDTKAARESMGFGNMFDDTMVKLYAQRGKEACAEFTKRTAQDGEAMVRQRMFGAQLAKKHFFEDRRVEPSQAVLTYIPSEEPDITVTKGNVEINLNPTELNIDWANTDIVPYQLDRGTVNFTVVQKAYIDIIYMGEPDYFPDSAEPAFSIRV